MIAIAAAINIDNGNEGSIRSYNKSNIKAQGTKKLI
jgi:hypothetical protein